MDWNCHSAKSSVLCNMNSCDMQSITQKRVINLKARDESRLGDAAFMHADYRLLSV